jgi:hypothetical protein
MTASPALRTFRDLRRLLRKAIDQATVGYEFSPNSYSYGALSACLAAEAALDVLGAVLETELGEGAAADRAELLAKVLAQ